ncbi:glycosyltransferase family 4 protein [Agromyces bauzanensis]
MRVRIATRIFEPEAAAAAFRLSALASALVSRGHSVTVVTSAPPKGLAAEPRTDGVAVRRAPVLRDARGQLRGYVQYLSFDVPLFFRMLFARRVDVVVVEPPPTSGAVVRLVSALRREPYVYYAADIWSDASATAGAPAWVVRAVRALERWAFRGARRVIAVSDGVADRVREISGRDRVTVVRNGIDTDVFTPDGPRATDGATIVYAGTTSEWQGADVFIRAMPRVLERVPDARLVYVGQGSAWEELRALAASHAPHAVDFVDAVPAGQAASFLRSARIGAVSLKPGQGYDFAVPTKIYASIACGTPVLFAGAGASVEVVRGDLGRSVDWAAEPVADAIVSMLRDEAPDARLARAGWAERNASIAATGRSAASVVEESA